MWETGEYLFKSQPAKDLMILLPAGFKPVGARSKLDFLKQVPNTVYKNSTGRRLIIMEDK